MKKCWSLFWILSVVFVTAVTVGGIFAARASGALCAAFVTSGGIVWVVFWAHFRSIGYYIENGAIIICSGFLIKAVRRVSIRDILWHTTVKIASLPLFSVIHTAAGRAVIFAPTDMFISSSS